MNVTIKLPEWFEVVVKGFVSVGEKAVEQGMPKEAEAIFVDAVVKLGAVAAKDSKVEM